MALTLRISIIIHRPEEGMICHGSAAARRAITFSFEILKVAALDRHGFLVHLTPGTPPVEAQLTVTIRISFLLFFLAVYCRL